MNELLIEIGTEEIPSSYIIPAVEALQKTLAQRLESLGMPFDDLRPFSSTRRLAVSALNIPAQRPMKKIKAYGPPKKAGFAPDGSVTKAAIGFAKGKGVDVAELKVENTEKGEYLFVEIEEGGDNCADILAVELPKLIREIPFPKSMRWGADDFLFTRPIHWIVALFGGEIIKFDIAGVQSGSTTRGHRFLGLQSIKVTGRDDYIENLQNNYVIVDQEERKAQVAQMVESAAQENGAGVLVDDDLAETVANLTEWPIALWGSYDEQFLTLPDELLIASMKNHQKMFSVVGENGKLTNGFIGVSNMKVEDNDVVVAGYKRVLRARLSDAKFFFDEDLKTPLGDFAKRLDSVVYQKKLGTVGAKIGRFTNLAEQLAIMIKPELKDQVVTTARLCKADLETLMVYEFPELQGVMGREYAKAAGEPEEIYNAIFEHYKPRWSGDSTPPSDVGAIVGIADKLDTLAGCFSIGLIPTGGADPFALRRGALGIIQTIFDKQYPLDLGALIDFALGQLDDKAEGKPEEIKRKLMEFFEGRLKNFWTGNGVSYDVADAVLSAGFNDMASANLRCEAMTELRRRDFFEPLAITFKRAANITKDHTAGKVDESLFENDHERNLHNAIVNLAGDVDSMINDKQYLAALEKIATLRNSVDSLFDNVMVMAKEDSIRVNRLNLLSELTGLFDRIANFSKLAGAESN